MPRVSAVWLGRMAYAPAWQLQREILQAIRQDAWPETLLYVEHEPVYTVGRGAHGSLEHLLWNDSERQQAGIQLYEVDRGGDITYHGPGQLVGYPILKLDRYGRDLHRYLRLLEEALIQALGHIGVEAGRLPPHTGVWVGDAKIAAIGVKASHWITQHGFALNVAPNLEHFGGIIPCGIEDKPVTSLRVLLAEVCPSLEAVRGAVSAAFGGVFGVELTEMPAESLWGRFPLEVAEA